MERTTISTGIKQFDEIFSGGLRTGDLCFIAARPARGKTTLAIQLAESIAEQGHKVCYFSLEKFPPKLNELLIQKHSVILAGSDGECELDETAKVNTDYIKKKLDKDRKIDVVFVDYFQLLDGYDVRSHPRQGGEFSCQLKEIARDYNVAVICCSALGRNVDTRRPVLTDLRKYGSVEQDIDEIIFIHRTDSDIFDISNKKTEFIIAKNRYGYTGTIEGVIDIDRVKFDFK
jgi:replicative DNA helicase